MTTVKEQPFPIITKFTQATDASPNVFNFDISDDTATTSATDQYPPNNHNQPDFYKMTIEQEIIQYDDEY